MANPTNTTPHRVTEPSVHFTHSTISRIFSRLIGAVAGYIEAERDIEHAAAFDPAFLHWHRDAETARAGVLTLIDQIRAAVSVRPEDVPLKRMALLFSALIESDSSADFLRLVDGFNRNSGLFRCRGSGAVDLRSRRMLTSASLLVTDLATLSACVDPFEATPDIEMAAVGDRDDLPMSVAV